MVSMLTRKTDSLTKRPRIKGFHKNGSDGLLTDYYNACFGVNEPVYCYEYIKGIDCRIVFLNNKPNDFLVGDSDKLLGNNYERFKGNKDHYGIYPYLHQIGKDLLPKIELFDIPEEGAVVFYFVLYGKHGKGYLKKQYERYTASGKNGHLLTDFCSIPDAENLLFFKDKDYFSIWREKQKGQQFLTPKELVDFSSKLELQLVPQLPTLLGPDVNISVAEMYGFLTELLPTTLAALDEESKDNAPYGITIRDEDGFAEARLPTGKYKDTLIKRGLFTEESDAE